MFSDRLEELRLPRFVVGFSRRCIFALLLLERQFGRGRLIDVVHLQIVRHVLPQTTGFRALLFVDALAYLGVDREFCDVDEHLVLTRSPFGHHATVPFAVHF